MKKIVIACLFIFAFLFFWKCNSGNTSKQNSNIDLLKDLKKDTGIRYAERFAIAENQLCKVIYLFGNVNIRDTSATYIFLKDSSIKVGEKKNTYIFNSSCKKIASLSSVYTNMLCELGEIDHISAIDNFDYYNNAEIINKFKKSNLPELSKNPELDIERTIVLNPDIIFTFGMGNPEKGANEKLVLAKIPMAVTVDHLEQTPLARAEWIKFFAAFVNKKQLADSVFNRVERNYMEIKKIASGAETKPTTFTEIKYGEIWYVPGGKSFMATFLNDAGSNYIWKDDAKTGSLHLGFEEVYVKAKDADFWLNLSLLKTKEELRALESRYAEFKAFKTGNLYNNIKYTNAKGYSDYWETGIMFPDRVLSDLVLIFHPELKSQIKNDLYYYRKLD